MLKASGAMAAATLLSRVLGMVRVMVYANFMGDKWVAGAFTFAFQIPNLFRRLLGEGALTAAFIPIFKERERNHGEVQMWHAANAVISGLVIVASVLSGVVMAIIAIVLAVHSFDASTGLMLRLLLVMFPYMILVCIAAVMMGMLNARGHFFIPAMGGTTLNLVMIASVLFFAPRLGLDLPKEGRLPVQIFALAYGVLVAGAAQAAFQTPTLWREGFRFRWVSPWKNETVRLVATRMIPGTIGVAAFQLNVLLVQGLAFWIDPRINASFEYAVRLMELPQGMFGISLATYLLTTLSSLALDKNYPEFKAQLRHGLGSLLFVNLVAAALLVALAEPIMRLLFERGEFTSDSTGRAAIALVYLAPGLVAFSAVNVLARAFFALEDTKTPMKISLVCLALNLMLATILVVPLKQGGLGIANTTTSIINVALLLFALRKKLGKLEMQSLRDTIRPLVLGALLACVVAWCTWTCWEQWLGHKTLLLKIGAVFVPATIAGSIYGLTAMLCKIPAAKEMTGLLLIKFKRFK
ncbi:MAG TPA: murein biosynthesis integral membrane protein MurJ [Verrucomicrobiae bacterium]|nr:murein biosynthesis integral membrane protein MurJ [Verrucomicrobiae bacterium]